MARGVGTKITSLVVVLSLLGSTGCASLFTKKSIWVEIKTTPPGADVWIDGKHEGKTPTRVYVDSKYSHALVVRKKGFQTHGQRIGLTLDPWVLLNVLNAFIGVFVDIGFGKATRTYSGDVHIKLKPRKASGPVARRGRP